jgi:hypothetical protein
MPEPSRNFKQRFCLHFACKEQEYERRALIRFLHRRSRLIALVVLRVNPSFFNTDLKILRQVALCESRSSYERDVVQLRNDYLREKDYGLSRRLLKLRLSVGRMIAVGAEVWSHKVTP